MSWPPQPSYDVPYGRKSEMIKGTNNSKTSRTLFCRYTPFSLTLVIFMLIYSTAGISIGSRISK